MSDFIKVRLIILGIVAALALLYGMAVFPFALARHVYSSSRWAALHAQNDAAKAADAAIGAANPSGATPLALGCDRKLTPGKPGSIAAWFGDPPAETSDVERLPKQLYVTAGVDAHLRSEELEWLAYERHGFFDDYLEILGEAPTDWPRRVRDYRWRAYDPTLVRYLAVSKIRDLTLSPSDGMPIRAALFVRVLDHQAKDAMVCEGTLSVPLHHREDDDEYGRPDALAAAPLISLCSAGGRELCDAVDKDYASR